MEYSLEVHNAHLTDKFQMFRQQHMLTDVVLTIQNEECLAHSAVLAAYSPTLCAMLTDSPSKNANNQIVLNLDSVDIHPENLVKMIDFMYTGNMVKLLNDCSIDSLQNDAHYLGIYQITQYTLKQMPKNRENDHEIPHCLSPTCLSKTRCELEDNLSNGAVSRVATAEPINQMDIINHKQNTEGSEQTSKQKRKFLYDTNVEMNTSHANPAKKSKFNDNKYEGSDSKQVKREVKTKQKQDEEIIHLSLLKPIIRNLTTVPSDINAKHLGNATETSITKDPVSNSHPDVEQKEFDSQNPLSQDIVQAALIATMGEELLKINATENTDNISATDNTVEEENITMKERKVEVKEELSEVVREEYDEDGTQTLSHWDEYYVNGNYVCPHCTDQKWKYLDKLCYHLIHEHGQKPFQCAQCGKEFTSKETFTEHLNKHSDIKPYLCSHQDCGKRFRTSRLLHTHKKIHKKKIKEAPSYPCPVEGCNEIFPKRQLQDSHLMSAHKGSKTFHCTFEGCSASRTTYSQLQKHTYTHTPAEDKHVVCEECGISISRKNLAEHMKSHTGSNHQCPYCSYATQHKRYIDSHMKRRHSRDKNGEGALKMHKCSECSFASFFAAELRTHSKKHNDKSMLKCDVCEYKTWDGTQMKAHKRIHTNDRPYICEICTKGFRQSNHLNRHSRLHTGDRPFVCVLCNRGYVDKRTMLNHQFNDHANVNQFLCHLCSFECVRQASLKIHMQKYHCINEFILDERKNRREITVSEDKVIVHDRSISFDNRQMDNNRMDPLIGDLKPGKETVSDLANLIPTTIDEHENLGTLLETPILPDQSDASLEQVIESINQSENPLQEVIGDIDQSEVPLPTTIPNLDQSLSLLQGGVNVLEQTDPDSDKRVLAEDDVKLITKALRKGNVVLHFV